MDVCRRTQSFMIMQANLCVFDLQFRQVHLNNKNTPSTMPAAITPLTYQVLPKGSYPTCLECLQF